MAMFQTTCSCGDTMEVDAANRTEAVARLKSMMDAPAIKAHMKEKHPGEELMSVADCHAMIEKEVALA